MTDMSAERRSFPAQDFEVSKFTAKGLRETYLRIPIPLYRKFWQSLRDEKVSLIESSSADLYVGPEEEEDWSGSDTKHEGYVLDVKRKSIIILEGKKVTECPFYRTYYSEREINETRQMKSLTLEGTDILLPDFAHYNDLALEQSRILKAYDIERPIYYYLRD